MTTTSASTSAFQQAARRLALRSFGALLLASAAAVLLPSPAFAHGGSAGDVVITHPFATPTPNGAVNGGAYFVSLENKGTQADKLLRASTPVASRVEIHTMSVDSGGVMRMREIGEIPLAAGAVVKMRPGEGMHLMLMGLKQPLKEGDTFPLTLEFERGGKTEVKVVVQVPKARGEAGMGEHKH